MTEYDEKHVRALTRQMSLFELAYFTYAVLCGAVPCLALLCGDEGMPRHTDQFRVMLVKALYRMNITLFFTSLALFFLSHYIFLLIVQFNGLS